MTTTEDSQFLWKQSNGLTVWVQSAMNNLEMAKRMNHVSPYEFAQLEKALRLLRPVITDTPKNMWGTNPADIDSDEFCPGCEHAIPGHLQGCPIGGKPFPFEDKEQW